MREPANVLKSLMEHSCNKQYKFERLYRNFYNPEFYYLAYRNIYATPGSMTAGSDGQTIDDMSDERIQKIIQSMRDFTYQPNPARRTYIEKKNSNKKRPLGIPSANDKLVQEIVRMILESIYEPNFSKHSHGFRPKRSCHTALMQIQETFTGIKWFVEGDITACFDSFNHHVLIELLRERIADENFIALMWKFLKAGYMEQWVHHKTLSGTPQGSGMSPILANIYLNELDKYVLQYKEKFDTGESSTNPEYGRAASKLFYTRRRNKKNWQNMTAGEKKIAHKSQREAQQLLQSLPSKRQNDKEYKRLQYCRYADDFLIGVIGAKADAEKVKADLKTFLADTLKLTLSDEKTKITCSTDKVSFLSYDVTLSKSTKVVTSSDGRKMRACSGTVALYVPHEKWFSKLIELKAIKIATDTSGNEKWVPLHRGPLINRTDIEIISKVNAEVRGLYNYYSIANNATVIKNFAFNMESSMYKTFGRKYKCSVKQIISKYSKDGRFMIPYDTKKGVKHCEFYNGGFVRQNKPRFDDFDMLPQHRQYDRPNSLRARLLARKCELCGCDCEHIRMHHIKKLKDLTGTSEWERIMIAKRRKTLAVCPKCHAGIHESS